jgi:hypothetical protein
MTTNNRFVASVMGWLSCVLGAGGVILVLFAEVAFTGERDAATAVIIALTVIFTCVSLGIGTLLLGRKDLGTASILLGFLPLALHIICRVAR